MPARSRHQLCRSRTLDRAVSEPHTVAGAASSIGRTLIQALPPAFLLLLLINFALFYVLLSAVEAQADQRLKILQSVIERCLPGQGRGFGPSPSP